ncbi:MAG: hypothetical protein HRT58_22575 [Crocinitomicaceae bacterium]|nr:hypothetical protein [Flavobacteriales bacterium]NQZ38464.1 hypothetical protein [Crocinitomicaceae bacterium]
MWFEKLTGFIEKSPEQVRSNLDLIDDKIVSKINQAEFKFGHLEVCSLELLRARTNPLDISNSKIKVSEIVGNVQSMHTAIENNGALFQAASQFNLLEMVGPHISPESGIGIYENDFTQGPACAIACGAGTIYRNYFSEVNGRIGQTRDNQIDCLEDIGVDLENSKWLLWTMSNGYALPSTGGLKKTTELILAKSPDEYDKLKSKLKVGIQWNTDVTINQSRNNVSQIYCSALPVTYSHIDPALWKVFAKLILEATYEATLHTALINYKNTGNNKVYLTLVGGGAFGNARDWIFDSMRKSLLKFVNTPLDIKIVSYGGSNKGVQDFVSSF